MRYRIAIITFLAYAAIHVMRTAFPFVQYDISKYYETDEKYIGILAAVTYLLIGIGYFAHNIIRPTKLVHNYSIEVSLSALFFMIIPISMFFGIKILAFGIICYGLYGWFQSASYPALTTIISYNFNDSEDGTLIGFWASTSDFGNIFGFFLSTVIIYYLHLDWRVTLILAGCLTLLTNALMKIGVPQVTIEDPQQKTIRQFCVQMADFLSNRSVIIYIVVLLMVSASEYGILLWLPMYLEQNNFKDFEGYISLTFSLGTMIGSTMIGLFYQQTDKRTYHFLIQIVGLFIGLIPLFIIYFFKITPDQQWLLLFLILVVGMGFGGCYNTNTGVQMIRIQNQYQNRIVVGNIVNGFSNLSIGIMQLIMGIVSSIDIHSIFLLFIVLGFLTILSLGLRILWNEERESVTEEDSF